MAPLPLHRNYWVELLEKIATPVIATLAAGELKKRMPIEKHPEYKAENFTHLEALGRTLCGIAPWLNLRGLTGEEEEKRAAMAAKVLKALDKATDPKSPDYMNFTHGDEPIVNAAILAQGLIRCREAIWDALGKETRGNIIQCLKATRSRKPLFSNWLMFAATTEAFLGSVGEDGDPMRIDFSIQQHEQWYKGDGIYGDGPFFHWDYYNSFVIQPMLLDVLNTVSRYTDYWKSFEAPTLQRSQRYAAVLERMIAPDGTFPVLGRSLAYRTGVFQLLGQIALLDALPHGVSPAQVRCAMTATMRRMLEAPGTFDSNGWLTIGFCGHQPKMGDFYISTGSLYLCLSGFLPLGLPPEHGFWSAPDEDWTSRKAWGGEDIEGDHAIEDQQPAGIRVWHP